MSTRAAIVIPSYGRPELAGVPRSLYGDLLKTGYVQARARLSRDGRWRLHARLRFNEALGRVMEARRLARVGIRFQHNDKAPA